MNTASVKSSYANFCHFYNKQTGIYKDALKYLPSLPMFFAVMKAVTSLSQYKDDFSCTHAGVTIDTFEREYYRDIFLQISDSPILGVWNFTPSPWYRQMVASVVSEYQKITKR